MPTDRDRVVISRLRLPGTPLWVWPWPFLGWIVSFRVVEAENLVVRISRSRDSSASATT